MLALFMAGLSQRGWGAEGGVPLRVCADGPAENRRHVIFRFSEIKSLLRAFDYRSVGWHLRIDQLKMMASRSSGRKAMCVPRWTRSRKMKVT
jgi:hypothetical protein